MAYRYTVHPGASGKSCAVLMACAKRTGTSTVSTSTGRWLVLRLGEVCRGSVTRTRKHYEDMDAAVDRLEGKFAHV